MSEEEDQREAGSTDADGASAQVNATLVEGAGSTFAGRLITPLLIYIGSGENDFESAGLAIDLSEVRRVCFGRAPAGRLRQERDGSTLRIGIPLAWASGAHAELALAGQPGAAPALRLKDLDSRNGTAVEGVELRGSCDLLPGQVFEIGRSFWMVRQTDAQGHAAGLNLDPTGTSSPALARVHRNLDRLAPSNLPILMLGETGTGKDYLAKAIHESSRPKGAFIHANLLAIPMSDLLMSEGDRPGLLERAAGGTVYIDELASLERDAQTKLACLLSYEGSGGQDPDVRMIVGTTRDIRPLVEQGAFRADLYARLSVYEAVLPALRERREDIGLLLRRLARKEDGSPITIETAALRKILGYHWPFNVRELAQTIRAVELMGDHAARMTAGDLDQVLRQAQDVPRSSQQVDEMREELLHELIDHQGDTDAVARSLGRGNREVESWLRRFDLDPVVYRQN